MKKNLSKIGLSALLYGILVFAVAFIIVSGLGVTVLDAIGKPFAKLIGVKLVGGWMSYGKIVVIPLNLSFVIIAIVILYIRTKTIRLDYFIAIIPVLVFGFALDGVLSIPAINTILMDGIQTKW